MTIKINAFISLVVGAILVIATVQARTVIQNKGSDTLVNVAQAWAEAYREIDPDVAVAVSGGGSGAGIAAMIKQQTVSNLSATYSYCFRIVLVQVVDPVVLQSGLNNLRL